MNYACILQNRDSKVQVQNSCIYNIILSLLSPTFLTQNCPSSKSLALYILNCLHTLSTCHPSSDQPTKCWHKQDKWTNADQNETIMSFTYMYIWERERERMKEREFRQNMFWLGKRKLNKNLSETATFYEHLIPVEKEVENYIVLLLLYSIHQLLSPFQKRQRGSEPDKR